jgi:hypothetical protein
MAGHHRRAKHLFDGKLPRQDGSLRRPSGDVSLDHRAGEPHVIANIGRPLAALCILWVVHAAAETACAKVLAMLFALRLLMRGDGVRLHQVLHGAGNTPAPGPPARE